MNWVINCSIAIVISLFYAAWEYNWVKNELVRDLMKDVVDISPVIILINCFSPFCAFFLLMCLVANVFINDCEILGSVLFMLAYGGSSVYVALQHQFSLTCLIAALVSMTIITVLILIVWNVAIPIKIAGIFYALLSLTPCLYVYVLTKNPGFFFLVAGDVLLIASQIQDSKTMRVISNSFYYIGTCLIPITLYII